MSSTNILDLTQSIEEGTPAPEAGGNPPNVLEMTNLEGNPEARDDPALDLTNLEGNPEDGNHPDSSRHYGAHMVQHYKFSILKGFVTVALLVVAITLSALSFQRSNEALALATASNEAAKTMESEFVLAVQNTAKVPAASKETPQPTSKPTTHEPTIPQPTGAPTDPHPLNPEWFHTDHEHYQEIIANNKDEDYHPWVLASMFCSRQARTSCNYDSYCPNGKGRDPYKGGPPKRVFTEDQNQNQWSPVAGMTQVDGFNWIQVGTISESDEGSDENGYGKCWNWRDWTSGKGGKIEDVLGEEHRQWILCCENGDGR